MADNRTEPRPGGARRIAGLAGAALGRAEVLALFPLLALTAAWFGFDDIAMVTAVGLAGLLAISALSGRAAGHGGEVLAATGGTGRTGLIAALARIAAAKDGRDGACLLMQIDDWPGLVETWGQEACEDIVLRVQERLRAALRDGDVLTRLGDARFGVVLGGMPSARLGLRDTIAARLANSVAEPLALRGAVLRLTGSVGHTALIRRGDEAAEPTFRAAEAALGDALLHGPGAIRAYASGMGRARSRQSALGAEVEAAIHDRAITAWFQPQIRAETGAVTGMEALARWDHPGHGLLSAREFLPAVEASGHLPLLGQSLIHQALKALAGWDRAEAGIGTVSVNLSVPELRDRDLPRFLSDEVARHGLDPARVIVEIAEPVAARTDDDAILATLTRLREAGHKVDLEGFGLGRAALPAIRRFGISRLKIDRSLLLGVDQDKAADQAVRAIIAYAGAMEIDTLAAGVETPQEIAHLTGIGCGYLQGFGIARPLRADRAADWARARAVSRQPIRLDDHRPG